MHPLAALAKVAIEKALFKKVAKEVNRGFKNIQKSVANDDDEIIEITDVVQATELSKGKISGWVAIVTALAYFASSQGYIDPAVAELINTLLSNEEVVQGIEQVVN